MSDEQKKKIGNAHRGKIVSEEARRNMSIAHLGQRKGTQLSEETKRKIGLKSIGRNLGRKHLNRKNKPFTQARKELISQIAKERGFGKWNKGRTGEKSPSWRGGLTSINSRIRDSSEYKLWRKSVFERDNYICIWCGARNGEGKTVKFHADHIKPFALYPELRFAIDNGRTLCVSCHRKTDSYGVRARREL